MFREDLMEVITHFGLSNQLKKLNEEVFELIEAIHFDMGDEESLDHIKEEYADVSLVLNQIKEYFEIGYAEDVLPRMTYKLDRTLKRIEEEK
jgi:NTP pyrophosphatase (non-canonical NTP hydrolase)